MQEYIEIGDSFTRAFINLYDIQMLVINSRTIELYFFDNKTIKIAYNDLRDCEKDYQRLKLLVCAAQEENEKMKTKITELEDIIKYMPPAEGGEGFHRASEEFHDLAEKKN